MNIVTFKHAGINFLSPLKILSHS